MERKTMKIKKLTDLYPGLYITIQHARDNKLEILKLVERRGKALEHYFLNAQADQWSVLECYYYFKDSSKNRIYESVKTITLGDKTKKTRRAGITEIYGYKITKLSEEIKYKEKFCGDDSILKNLMLPFY